MGGTAAGGAATTYVVEAGSAPGVANLANVPTNSTLTGAGFAACRRAVFRQGRARNLVGTSGPRTRFSSRSGARAAAANQSRLHRIGEPGHLHVARSGLGPAPKGTRSSSEALPDSRTCSWSIRGRRHAHGRGPPGTYFVRVKSAAVAEPARAPTKSSSCCHKTERCGPWNRCPCLHGVTRANVEVGTLTASS